MSCGKSIFLAVHAPLGLGLRGKYCTLLLSRHIQRCTGTCHALFRWLRCHKFGYAWKWDLLCVFGCIHHGPPEAFMSFHDSPLKDAIDSSSMSCLDILGSGILFYVLAAYTMALPRRSYLYRIRHWRTPLILLRCQQAGIFLYWVILRPSRGVQPLTDAVILSSLVAIHTKLHHCNWLCCRGPPEARALDGRQISGMIRSWLYIFWLIQLSGGVRGTVGGYVCLFVWRWAKNITWKIHMKEWTWHKCKKWAWRWIWSQMPYWAWRWMWSLVSAVIFVDFKGS